MLQFSFKDRFKNILKACVCAFYICIFASCATQSEKTEDLQRKYNKALSSHFSQFEESPASSEVLQAGRSSNRPLSGPIAVIGTGKFIEINEIEDLDQFDLSKLGGNPNDGVMLNFSNVPVKDAARAIMGEILNLNYSIDPQVVGNITFKTSMPIKRADLLGLFQDLLSRQRLVLSEQNNIFLITTVQDAIKSQGILPPGTKKIDDATVSPIPLQYVSATQLASVLSPVVSQYATIQVDAGRNMLLVKSDTEHLSTVYDLIQIFDVDWMAGLSFAMYPLAQTTPANIIKDLQGIFKNESQNVMSGMVDFLPIDRLNAILVVTKNPQYLIKVAKWIEQLDRGDEGSMGLYVYKLTHTKADMISDVLGNIFGAKNIPTTQEMKKSSSDDKSSQKASDSNNTSNSNSNSNSKSETQTQTTQHSIQAGNINIYPDVRNNSVVVRASPSDYKMVEVALRKLDVPPLQVMIEATIAQVALGDNFELGLQWFFNKQNTLGKVQLGSIQTAGSNISTTTSNAFSYIISKSSLGATLSALQTMTDVKVVSSPHVMVLNNESASLNSGTEVPITKQITSSITTTGTPVQTDIEYRKLGVNLDVTPHITGSDMVNLKIKQSINSVLSAGTQNTPTIQNQSVDTIVSLKSGDTVALGGLIADNETKAKGGVPYLRDIPLVGNLFSQQKSSKSRTELLILITPHIVKNPQQANLVTNELKYRMATATVFAQNMNDIYVKDSGRLNVGLIDGPQPAVNPALQIHEPSVFETIDGQISNKQNVQQKTIETPLPVQKLSETSKINDNQPVELYSVKKQITKITSSTPVTDQVIQTASLKKMENVEKDQYDIDKPVIQKKQPKENKTQTKPQAGNDKVEIDFPIISRGSGNEYVQLSALKNNHEALDEWRIIKGKYPDTLGKLSPVIKEYTTVSGNIYFRLQAGPISAQQASDLCYYLKSHNQACMVIK